MRRRSHRFLRPVLLSLAVVALSCGLEDEHSGHDPGEATASAPVITLAEFEVVADTERAVFDVRMLPPNEWSDADAFTFDDDLRTVPQALWCERRVTRGGASDTFSLFTDPASIGSTVSACGLPPVFPYSALGAFCADVTVHSHFDETVVQVMAEILTVDPPEFAGYTFTGTAGLIGVDADNLPGPNPPTDSRGGLIGYGDIAAGASAGEQWVFQNPSGTFRFRGRLVSQIPRETCNGIDDDCDGEVDEDAGCLAFDEPCTSHFDCASGNCAEPGRCGASLCLDGLQNASETDVDCGGACSLCIIGQACVAGTDCGSGNCRDGACVLYRHPAAGEIIVSEFMPDPGVGDTDGEWVELYNATTGPLDLTDCVLRDDGSNTHTLGALSVAAGDYVVLARSADDGLNHGVGDDYAYGSSFSLSNTADEIILDCSSVEIDRVEYTSAIVTRGASSQLHSGHMTALANDVAANFCPSRAAYSVGYDGSPGSANASCDFVIDRCRVQSPTNGSAPAAGSHQVFGRLYSPGLTDTTPAVDNSLRVWGELGFGDTGTDPAADPSWTWVTAAANGTWIDAAEPGYDEYQATFAVPDAPGTTRDVAYRFTGNNGTAFTYCDTDAGAGADGSENGYQIANAATLAIAGAATAPAVEGDLIINEIMPRAASPDDGNGEWVELHNPGGAALDLAGCVLHDLGSDTHTIAASVLVPAGGYAVLAASGDAGLNFGVPHDYVYDGFVLANTVDEVVLTCGGTEIDRVVYPQANVVLGRSMSLLPTRTSTVDNDLAVAWCSNLPAVTYGSAAKVGTPGLANVPCYALNWCRLQSPLDLVDQRWGSDVLVYGRVDIPGLSDTTDGTDTAPQIVSQAGYGPDGSDPGVPGAGWTWFDGEANTSYDNGSVDFFPGHDEYQSTITLPTDGTARDFAMRFSADGGVTWGLYCDRRIGSEASTDGSADGYQPANAGQLDMDADYTIGWCSLDWPAHVPDTLTGDGLPVPFAGQSQDFFGRIFVAGVTEPGGTQERANIRAQFGHGPDGTDPTGGAWTWDEAVSNPGPCVACGNNDEYLYPLTVPTTTAAPYDTAYRFSGDGGQTWTYCDADGTTPPAAYEIPQAGHLQPNTATIGWCDMQAHRTFSGTEGDPVSVEMRVWGPDLTPLTGGAPDASPDFLAEFMYVEDTGAPLPDPRSAPGSFTRIAGALTGGIGNDDLYTATFTLPGAASYRTAIRFSGDGGSTWGVCGEVALMAAVEDMGTMTVTSAGPPPFECLLLSQYVEGSGWTKAVEVWNCGSDPVNLGDYDICKYANGGTTSCASLTLSGGTLAAGDTWTVCHSSGSYGAGRCDQSASSSALSFNGNDEIVLRDRNDGNAILDRVGITGDSDSWGANDTRHRTSCWKSDGTITDWDDYFVLADGGATDADLDLLGAAPTGFSCAAGTGSARRCTVDMDDSLDGSCPSSFRICGALLSGGIGCGNPGSADCRSSGTEVYGTNIFVVSTVDLGRDVSSVDVFFAVTLGPFPAFGYDIYDNGVPVDAQLLDATYDCSASAPPILTITGPGAAVFDTINFSSGLDSGFLDDLTIER